MGGFRQKVVSPNSFGTSEFKSQEVKAEILIHLFILNPNVFSKQEKQRNWPCCSNTLGDDFIYGVSIYVCIF